MAGIADFLPPVTSDATSGGFWPTGTSDPRFGANIALAAGLMAGRPAEGFAGYGAAFGPEAQLKRAQVLDTQQQIGLRGIQLQQQQRLFDLQTPFLEAALSRLRASQGMPGAQPVAPVTTGTTMDGPSSASFGGAPMQGAAPGGQPQQPMNAPKANAAPAAQAAPAQPGGSTMFPGIPDDVSMNAIGFGGVGAIPAMLSKYNEPTEFIKTLRAANIDPNSPIGRQMILGNIAKSNYIAPTSLRPGGYAQYADGTLKQLPQIPEGFTAIQQPDGSFKMVKVDGSDAAVQTSTQNKTIGQTLGTLREGVNPETGAKTFVLGVPPGTVGADAIQSPAAPQAASSTVPAPLRNNNPGAMMPGGKLAQYPSMEAGLQALDQNLQSYGKQGVSTLSAVISKWAPPNENDTNAYIKNVAQRLGLDPNQPIDLTNAATRHALATGIMLHENGPAGVFAKPAASPGAPVAAPGAIVPGLSPTNEALMDQGKGYYKAATTQAEGVPQLRQMLSEINDLAKDPKNTFGPGSPAVARWKALANNVGIDLTGAQTAQDIMGKLASNIVMSQLGQGGQTGTDAQMGQILHANPNGEMTNEAIKQVVPMLMQQLDVREARAKVLNNAVTGNGGNVAKVPNLLNDFNRLASPPVVSLGAEIAQAQRNGTLAQLIKGLSPQQRAMLPAVKQLDQMGAF